MCKVRFLLFCLLVAAAISAGCAVTEYNPRTGMARRVRVMTESDVQGFLAETPDGTHVEWESARSKVSDMLKALVQFGIELGKQMAAYSMYSAGPPAPPAGGAQ